MDLPFLKNESEQPENFWSLVLGKNWVDSAIWRVVGEKAEIVSHGGAFPYQEGDKTSLVEAADGSLSNAFAKLPQGSVEPKKVVFGLPPGYLEDGEIKKEFVEILRVLSKELELTPAGFVVIPEAIIHLLKSQEGAPPNVILVGSGEDTLEVTLVQNGKALGTTEVARSMSTGTDLQEAINRLPEVLQYPTRILVYNHKNADIEATKDNLLASDWEKIGLSFLHTPKVEVLPEDVVATAISLAGGAEVGNATELAVAAPTGGSDAEGLVLDTGSIQTERASGIDEDEVTEINEFVSGEITNEAANVKTVSPEELGFKEDEDAQEKEFAVPPVYSPRAIQPPPTHALSSLSAKKNPLAGLLSSIPSVSLPRFRVPGGKPAFYVAAAVLAAVAIGLFYWFMPSAQVSVFVSPKTYEKELTLKVNSKELPARVLEVEKTVNKEADTTGTASIGDRATGEVTIYRVGPQTTLAKGTILSSGSLKFTLDRDVKVASGSAGPDSLGKNTEIAPVTASTIGPDSNLPSGSSFKIGTFSTDSTTAKNDKAFTGGSAREVQAVSLADLDNLEESAKKELEEKANEDLQGRLKESEILIAQVEGIVISSKDFTQKEGDEAQRVSVKITGKAKFFAVSKSDIKKLLEQAGGLPEGFSLKEDQIKMTTEPKGKNEFKAKITANLLPQVQPESLRDRIAGKSLTDARNILSGTPGFQRAEIIIKFKLPGPLATLPRRSQKIGIEIVAD